MGEAELKKSDRYNDYSATTQTNNNDALKSAAAALYFCYKLHIPGFQWKNLIHPFKPMFHFYTP